MGHWTPTCLQIGWQATQNVMGHSSIFTANTQWETRLMSQNVYVYSHNWKAGFPYALDIFIMHHSYEKFTCPKQSSLFTESLVYFRLLSILEWQQGCFNAKTLYLLTVKVYNSKFCKKNSDDIVTHGTIPESIPSKLQRWWKTVANKSFTGNCQTLDIRWLTFAHCEM